MEKTRGMIDRESKQARMGLRLATIFGLAKNIKTKFEKVVKKPDNFTDDEMEFIFKHCDDAVDALKKIDDKLYQIQPKHKED